MQNRTNHAKAKFCKRATKTTQDKIVFKKLADPSKKIKNTTHNPTDNDTKAQQRQWFTDTDDRTPAANSGLA